MDTTVELQPRFINNTERHTTRMKKIILGLVAAAAVAAPIALSAGSASASVAVTNGVGFVGKGDVQNALGYANDAAIQADAASIKFGGGGDYTLTTDKDTSWTCSDGSTQHHHFVTTTI